MTTFRPEVVNPQALPTGNQIWMWAIANSPAIAAAINEAVNADRPREVWSSVKKIGDLLIELIDPETSGIAANAFTDIPWDKVVTILLPIIVEFIRKRRAERGA